MNSKLITYFLSGICLVSACDLLPEKNIKEGEKTVIARVYDSELTPEELRRNIPTDLSSKDSSEIAERLIDHWVRTSLKLKLAEGNFEGQQEINQKVESYRKSLILHEFKDYYINNNLDTNISEELLVRYYKNHEKDFSLRQDIMKGLFLKVAVNAPDLNKIRTLMEEEPEDIEQQLISYSARFGKTYIADDSLWVDVETVLREIPASSLEKLPSWEQNKLIELSDQEYAYFLKIKEYKAQGETAPYEYVKTFIRTILLNKKKNDILSKLEDSLYNEAKKANEITIY